MATRVAPSVQHALAGFVLFVLAWEVAGRVKLLGSSWPPLSQVLIALTTPVKFSDIVVAFAPGAMDAMLALALTLHIDPIFVGAHHLSRFVFVTIATPGIVHLFGRPQEDVDD